MLLNDDIFTIPQAAKHCSISRVTLWRWVKSGILKAFPTPGGHYKIRKKDLESFIRVNMGYLSIADYFQDKKILIVDDDPKIQKLLTRVLCTDGYQIEVAVDGFDAGIKVVQFKPDLIILDLVMPLMDGFEVCRRLKKDSNSSNIKILILTGYDNKENMDLIMEAGADAFLSKPVGKNVLLQHIEELLNNNEFDKREVMEYGTIS